MKKIIAILICLLLMSGCVKNTNTMTINKDKSMTYEVELLLSDSLTKTIEDYVNVEELKERNFEVNNSKYEGYSGINISKHYKSIDDLSTDTSNEKVMSNYLDKEFDEKEMFKRDSSFFKDTYVAKFKFKIDKSQYNEEVNTKIETPKVETKPVDNATNTENNIGTGVELKPSNNLSNDEDDMSVLGENSKLYSEMEFLFKLNLPYKFVSSNATEESADGKLLTWKLNDNGDTAISFTFYILNWTHIFIVGGIGLVVLVGLIVAVIILVKKKSNQATLIHIDYDESIADKVENDVLNAPATEEVSLPDDNKEEK